MNVHMMEGLAGASASIQQSEVSMRVYRQASNEGDTEKMKRALGYAGKSMDQAQDYQKKLAKGMKEEAQAQREKEKLEKEKLEKKKLEKERLETKELEKKEPGRKELGKETPAESGETGAEVNPAKASPAAEASPGGDPMIYNESGQAAPAPETEATVTYFA